MKTLRTSSILLAAVFAGCATQEPAPAPAPAATPAPAARPAPAPQARPAPSSAPRMNPLDDPNSILSKRSVYYDFDKSDIKPSDRPLIEAHARYLREHPGAQVTIEGNCDERGSREYNVALGQRRAEGVKKAMVVAGASEKQLEAVSFGEEKPKAAGHDEAAWSQNRRSDLNYTRKQ